MFSFEWAKGPMAAPRELQFVQTSGITPIKTAENGNRGATTRIPINGNANSKLGILTLIGFIPF
jgi:hypothetical protein